MGARKDILRLLGISSVKGQHRDQTAASWWWMHQQFTVVPGAIGLMHLHSNPGLPCAPWSSFLLAFHQFLAAWNWSQFPKKWQFRLRVQFSQTPKVSETCRIYSPAFQRHQVREPHSSWEVLSHSGGMSFFLHVNKTLEIPFFSSLSSWSLTHFSWAKALKIPALWAFREGKTSDKQKEESSTHP